MPGQEEVGFAGEGPVFRTADGEAVAEAVEHGAQGELRPGVAAADAGHDDGALGGGEDVDHGSSFQYRTRNAECRREDGLTAEAQRSRRNAKKREFLDGRGSRAKAPNRKGGEKGGAKFRAFRGFSGAPLFEKF